MTDLFGPELRRDLIKHRFSRRDFGRLAALLTAGASLPFYNEAALAQGLSAGPRIPSDAVKINANENPMGPCPEAAEAIHKIVSQGGRYLYEETFAFSAAMAAVEGVSAEHVMPFAGSSDPLHRAVLAFTGPDKSYVVADPGYEAGSRAARFIGAKTITVPLRKDYAHDVHAMAQADPNAGLIYVCNPNNPTGSITPKEDIEYLVAHKPERCDYTSRRGIHSPIEDGRAGLRARRGRQGRDYPPDLFQALRHGRPPCRRGTGSPRPDRQAARLRCRAPCRSPAWWERSPA